VCVIDLPGLSRELVEAIQANSLLGEWIGRQRVVSLKPSWPAVTCSVQATITTGVSPAVHGIVANGVATYRSAADQALVDASNFAGYRREVSFWEQSNQFIEARRFWQREDGTSRFKTALLFFQNSMPGFGGTLRPAADVVITPKPEHGADGKITSLLWAEPAGLVKRLFGELGPFPLMNYWGPMAGIASSAWIAKAAAAVWHEERPDLQMVYVPHLDYDLQRFGPDSQQAKQAVADVAMAVEPLSEAVRESGGELVVLSEYGMETVDRSIAPNALLRDANLLQTRPTADGPLVDYERSRAFVMVDHQIGHVYVRSGGDVELVRKVLERAGVVVLDRAVQEHRRSGDLLIEAPAGSWLDYRWWREGGEAPVFAGMVDIHRKPGYDPLELFFDPATRGVTQDARRVRGSHGRGAGTAGVLIGAETEARGEVSAEEVEGEILRRMGI
jgi:predicted AlkP superfamily pyrophosphatase or phosphodiesterase